MHTSGFRVSAVGRLGAGGSGILKASYLEGLKLKFEEVPLAEARVHCSSTSEGLGCRV